MNICRESVLTENEAHWLVASKDQSFIGFTRLTSISQEVAGVLAHYGGCLAFSRLVNGLCPAAAAELANHTGGVILNGLTELLPETAAELGNYKGRMLYLDEVTSLSVETAGGLGRYLGGEEVSLSLKGVKSLPDNAAAGLAKYLGRVESSLNLSGLTTLSAESARELAKCRGILELQGVIRPSTKVLAMLMSSPAIRVVLNDEQESLRKMDEAPADYAEQAWMRYGIDAILVDCAKSNPKWNGQVDLASIEQMPDDLTAMYFAHIFGDHSLQNNDRWQFKRWNVL